MQIARVFEIRVHAIMHDSIDNRCFDENTRCRIPHNVCVVAVIRSKFTRIYRIYNPYIQCELDECEHVLTGRVINS